MKDLNDAAIVCLPHTARVHEDIDSVPNPVTVTVGLSNGWIARVYRNGMVDAVEAPGAGICITRGFWGIAELLSEMNSDYWKRLCMPGYAEKADALGVEVSS